MRFFLPIIALLVASVAALPHHGGYHSSSHHSSSPPNMLCQDGTVADCLCDDGETCYDQDAFDNLDYDDWPWPNCNLSTFKYSCIDESEPENTALVKCVDNSNITCTCTTEGKEDCTDFLPCKLTKVRGDKKYKSRSKRHDHHREERGPPPCKLNEMALTCSDGAEPKFTVRPRFVPVQCQESKCDSDDDFMDGFIGVDEDEDEDEEEEDIVLAECKCRDSGLPCYTNEGDDVPACQPTQWQLTCPAEAGRPFLPFLKNHRKMHYKHH